MSDWIAVASAELAAALGEAEPARSPAPARPPRRRRRRPLRIGGEVDELAVAAARKALGPRGMLRPPR